MCIGWVTWKTLIMIEYDDDMIIIVLNYNDSIYDYFKNVYLRRGPAGAGSGFKMPKLWAAEWKVIRFLPPVKIPPIVDNQI